MQNPMNMLMRYLKIALLECLLISAIGLAIGLGANAMYSDGVELSRDYFPRKKNAGTQPPAIQEKSPAGQDNPITMTVSDKVALDDAHVIVEEDPLADAVSYLQEQGLQVIRHDQVEALYNDPLYQQGIYVIIDARDDTNYEMGHIPGAYQWDHYRYKQYIDEVLPACQAAEKIVLYCNGGDCEDSEFATIDLMDQGIDPGKLFVYPGGMTLWKQKDLPTERGKRSSGDIVNGLSIPGAHHD